MPLYFAYGSNMDVPAMAQRCPSARVIGPARLMRHRFIITRDGYASVIRDPQQVVHGLMWDVPLAEMRALDRYESIGTGLYTKVIQPVASASGARKAIIYIGTGAGPGTPRPGYMEAVHAAAVAAALPDAYLRQLAAWLPRGATSGNGGTAISATGQTDEPAATGRVAVQPRQAAPASTVRPMPRR